MTRKTLTKRKAKGNASDEVTRIVRVEYVTDYYAGPLGLRTEDPDPLRARELATLAVIEHLEAVGLLMSLVSPPDLVEAPDPDSLRRMVRGAGSLINELAQNLARLTDIEASE